MVFLPMGTLLGVPPSGGPMMMVFQTTGVDEDVTLPLPEYDYWNWTIPMVYNFEVDWGDGSPPETITAFDQAEVTHTYALADDHTVTITGQCEGWSFDWGGHCLKLIEITQWGDVGFVDLGAAFAGCENMVVSATDTPGLSGCLAMQYTFAECHALGDLVGWQTGSVTDMEGLFDSTPTFNGDLTGWDLSAGPILDYVFNGCTAFNHVSVSGWDVSAVASFRFMFNYSGFNQDLSGWVLTAATNLQGLFGGSAFTSDSLSGWDVSGVEGLDSMFSDCPFNGDISGWVTTSALDLSGMFYGTSAFNGDISGWDVSNVTDMASMFYGNTVFNSDITGWDTGSVTDMNFMFYNNTAFNQDLGGWDISSLTSAAAFAIGVSGFSVSMYSKLLAGWAAQTVQSGVTLNVLAAYYLQEQTNRDTLTVTNSWSISDGGTQSNPVAANLIWDTDTSVIRGRYNHTNQVWDRSEFYRDDDGEGGGETLFGIHSSISGDSSRYLYYPWADAEPVDLSLYWIRYVQPASGVESPVMAYNGAAYVPIIWDTPQRMDGSTATNAQQDYNQTVTPIHSYNYMECASSQFFVDICEDDGFGAPDGSWQRRDVILMSTGSDAFEELMFWGGSPLVVEEVSSNPQPTLEFKSDGDVDYSSGGGTLTTPWYDGGGLSNGRWEIGQWGEVGFLPTGGDVADVISEDALLNTYAMNNSNHGDEHELLGSKYYFDFSGDPIGTIKEAMFYVYVMDNNNNWREVSRLVILRGEKTA